MNETTRAADAAEAAEAGTPKVLGSADIRGFSPACPTAIPS